MTIKLTETLLITAGGITVSAGTASLQSLIATSVTASSFGAFSGSGVPTAGSSVEVKHDGTTGFLISYDRTAAAYKALQYAALSHAFATGNVSMTNLAQGPILGLNSGNNSCFVEFSRTGYVDRGSVGCLGTFEMNVSYNMDYTTGVHRLYDTTKSAIWFAMNAAGLYLQYAPATGAAGDIWDATGNKYNLFIDNATGMVNFRGGLQIGGTIPTVRADLGLNIALTTTGATQYGLVAFPTFDATGVTAGYGALFIAGTAAAAFTQAATYGVAIGATSKGAGSTITVNYGLHIAAQTAGATNYAIYTAGATPSLFNGPVGINGKTPVANVAAPAAATDLATVITLANDMRTRLINFGLYT